MNPYTCQRVVDDASALVPSGLQGKLHTYTNAHTPKASPLRVNTLPAAQFRFLFRFLTTTINIGQKAWLPAKTERELQESTNQK